jgi:hypothetical protein
MGGRLRRRCNLDDRCRVNRILAMAEDDRKQVDKEAEDRLARMRAAGHGPFTEEELRQNLDETLTMIEWDPDFYET